ncbi:hypothetical protein JCM6882_005103 [Rhodosporidiobolus microsporus]
MTPCDGSYWILHILVHFPPTPDFVLSSHRRSASPRPPDLSAPSRRLSTLFNDDDWSDSSSVASDVEVDEEDSQLALYDPSQETFAERFAALKDMISPSTRASISDTVAQAQAYTKWTVGKVGAAAWITCTSALLVGLPLLLSIEGEAAIVQQEKEFLAQPGAPNPYGAPAPAGAAPAGAPAQGIVPSGF